MKSSLRESDGEEEHGVSACMLLFLLLSRRNYNLSL